MKKEKRWYKLRQFGNFKHRIEKRKITIVEYCGETKTVIVPKTIKGLPVLESTVERLPLKNLEKRLGA